MATAAEIYASAVIWDDHAGFECRPDAKLEQLGEWREAGVTYLSVNVGYDVRPWANTVKTLASFRRQVAASEDCVLVASIDDIHNAKRQGKLAVTFDIEGMESLDGDADMIDVYYDLGVRHMLFAYNLNNRAGGGCHDQDIGLTDFGREVIARMNQVGMVVDCSHSAYRTTMEAMEASTQPVVFSHSNPRALVDHPRNITDDQIKACAGTGGVIGINGVSLFMDDDGVTPERFADLVVYVAELVGSGHVGMGLDFVRKDPSLEALLSQNRDFWPSGNGYERTLAFMAPDTLPRVAELLLTRGFSEGEVRGVLGKNLLSLAQRVWK